jgi:hypothetical protein
MKAEQNNLKVAIETKLKTRSIEQLKADVIAVKNVDDYGSNIIFVTALNILEERMSESDYKSFEDSL